MGNNSVRPFSVKPIIHNWPGSQEQFEPWTFDTLQEAVAQIMSDEYDSQAYLNRVEERFSTKNVDRVLDIAIGEERKAEAA